MSKNALQAVLDKAAAGSEAPPAGPAAAAPAKSQAATARARSTAARVPPVRSAEAGERFFRPSREDKKLIAGHFDPKVAKQLKLLAVEDDTTVQALLEEALDLLFAKKGRARIGDLLRASA